MRNHFENIELSLALEEYCLSSWKAGAPSTVNEGEMFGIEKSFATTVNGKLAAGGGLCGSDVNAQH